MASKQKKKSLIVIQSTLLFSHKMWVGGFTFWFGSWIEISKSPISGENINWPLAFLFFTLKLWCTPLRPEQIFHHDFKCEVLGETYALFCQNKYPKYHNSKEKYQHLKLFWLRSSKRQCYVLTQESLGQHAENICRPEK